MRIFRFKSSSLLLALFAGLMISATAQKNPHHNIQIAPLKLIGGNTNLRYEYRVSPKTSIGVEASFRGTKLDGQSSTFTDNDGIETEWTAETARIKGTAISPHATFYFGKKEGMRGFFLSPYLRYSTNSFEFDAYFIENQQRKNTDGSFGFSGFGLGGELGWQWMIGDVVTIRWAPISLGALFGRYEGEFFSDNLTEEDWADFEAELRNAGLTPNDINFTREGNRATASVPGAFPIIRSYFGIGIAF